MKGVTRNEWWTCDQCGRSMIQSGEAWNVDRLPVPDGWVVLRATLHVEGAVAKATQANADLCSRSCVDAWMTGQLHEALA